MKKNLLIILCILGFAMAHGQTAPGKYWVQFTDKADSPFTLDEPLNFLSQRALDRRERYGIQVTTQDLPVNPAYLDSVRSVGVSILHASRWFNGVSVATENPELLDLIRAFSFVSDIKTVRQGKGTRQISKTETIVARETMPASGTDSTYYDYGDGAHQIGMVNGHILHNQGFRGKGLIIAVLDGGFTGVRDNPAFDSLWERNQILGHWDFVLGTPLTFQAHTHGGQVLSVMAANMPGRMVGTAPEAAFYLFRTEDGGSEYLIEEDNWVVAVEMADSAGADLVNSSLGYTQFDDPSMDHQYEDMDGNTTRITQAADYAAAKGMLIVTSASNLGHTDWQYIGAPADGDSVLSVGAVDALGQYAYFSSTGPTFDGRIKPNVAAMGQATAIVSSSGEVIFGSGTSFSSPLICGLCACLWQADPDMSNMDVIRLIEQTASQANQPDQFLGYGIPDFSQAFFGILGIESVNTHQNSLIRVFPVPFSNQITVDYFTPEPGNFDLQIMDLTGRVLWQQAYAPGFVNLNRIRLSDLSWLPNGSYVVRVVHGSQYLSKPIVKQTY